MANYLSKKSLEQPPATQSIINTSNFKSMPRPTVIIELFENTFEALYSNTDLAFIIVNRTENQNETTISGPHAPTLEKSDLSGVIDGVQIPHKILSAPADQPYFVPEETYLLDLTDA
jgi:hypothetical protein